MSESHPCPLPFHNRHADRIDRIPSFTMTFGKQPYKVHRSCARHAIIATLKAEGRWPLNSSRTTSGEDGNDERTNGLSEDQE